jgi:hypothetical protein
MSKEVQIVPWCDGDHEEAVRAEVERTVAVDGSKTILLDLCQPCDKLFEDLSWLMERGVQADKVREPRRRKASEVRPVAETPRKRKGRQPPPGAKRVDCQEPSCLDPRTGEPYMAPTRSALGQHIKQKHHKLLSDYDWTA